MASNFKALKAGKIVQQAVHLSHRQLIRFDPQNLKGHPSRGRSKP